MNRDRTLALVIERVLIVLGILVVYGLLMQRYPIIYGGDPVARLVNYPRILNGHQLPLLQVLLHFTMRWFYGPKAIFVLMALISAAACTGVHALTWVITQDRSSARLAAILYAAHPFILFYSRVPYQEPLAIAGIFWGFYFLFRPGSAPGLMLSSAAFGIACLSRYECWIAALVAAFYLVWRKWKEEGTRRMMPVVLAPAAFGWVPAGWMAWNCGLSPAGSYVLDLELSWGRLYRPYFIAKSTLWWTGSAVVLLALMGFARFRADEKVRRSRQLHSLLATVALLLTALVFSGHGIEPDATHIVTEREAFIPVSVLILFAGAGASRFIEELREWCGRSLLLRSAVPALAIAVAAGYGLDRGIHRVAAAGEELKTDYEVAQFLSKRQARGLILAAPLPAEQMASYLHSVEKWSGSAGREKAQQLLKEMETAPLDYQRVLMYSWMGKDKLIPGQHLRGLDRRGIAEFLQENRIDYLILFSGFTPVAEHEKSVIAAYVAHCSPELEISNAGRSATIYPIRHGDGARAEKKGNG